MQRAKLTDVFAELVPLMRDYLATKCFGGDIDLDEDRVRECLRDVMIQEAIVEYLATRISKLTVEKRDIEFENESFKLSKTKPFVRQLAG